MKLRLLALLPAVGCAANANDVIVTLQPEVISSQDGMLGVHAVVLGDNAPKEAQAVTITVDYKDRNGTAHMIAPFDGKTDKSGAIDNTFTGLTWDGTGTVTVQVGTKGPSGTATFAVLAQNHRSHAADHNGIRFGCGSAARCASGEHGYAPGFEHMRRRAGCRTRLP